MDIIIRVTLLYQVLISLLPTQASDLELCGTSTQQYDLTYIKSQDHDLEEGRVFKLLQSQIPLTWCQARQACQQEDLNLATIESQDTYISVKKLALDSALNTDAAWLSGRRQTTGWTWVTDDLTKCHGLVGDFNCSRPTRPGVEYGTSKVEIIEEKLQQYAHYSIADGGLPYICMVGKEVQVSTTGEVSWYDAQNACVLKGGRLATFAEIASHAQEYGNPSAPTYWNGLQYNPWVWIVNNGDDRPLYYSTFAADGILTSPGGDQCLAARLTSGLHWNQVGCESNLSYLICQNKASTTAALSWWVILIIVVVGFIILLIVIVWLRGKCAKDPLDPDPEEAAEAMAVSRRKGSDTDGKSEGKRHTVGKDQIHMVKLHATTADVENPMLKRMNGVSWNHYVRSTSQPDSPSSQLIPTCPDPDSSPPLQPSAPDIYTGLNKPNHQDTTVVIENTNYQPMEESNQEENSPKDNNNVYNEVETLPLLNKAKAPGGANSSPPESTPNESDKRYNRSNSSSPEQSAANAHPKVPPPKPSRLLQPTRPAPGYRHSENSGSKVKPPKPPVPPKPKANTLKQ